MQTQTIKKLGHLIGESCSALRQLWWDLPDAYDRTLVTASVRTLHSYLTALEMNKEEVIPHSSSGQLTDLTRSLALLVRLEEMYTAVLAEDLPSTLQAQLQAQQSEITDLSAALGYLLNAYLNTVTLETQSLPSKQATVGTWLLAS